jgi:hypothetical protein
MCRKKFVLCRKSQVTVAVLLFAGILFVFDVLSPLTPTPHAQIANLLGIVLVVILALVRVDAIYLVQGSLLDAPAGAWRPCRSFSKRSYVLLC